MNTRTVISIAIGIALSAFGEATVAQSTSTSTITYQGRLALNGLAVNEDCEVVFRLYDSAVGGNLVGQVGSEAMPRIVDVRKGLFTQPLDFGAGVFSGGERWLEIAVRPSGSGGPYSVLSPRQCVTPTPYALHALSGGDVSSLDQAYNKGGPGAGRIVNATNGPMSIEGDGGLVVSGNVGIGTPTPNSKLEVAGVVHSTDGGFMFPDGSVQTTAALSINEPRALGDCLDGPGGVPADVLCVDDTGNTGVGYFGAMANFAFTLDVDGDIRSTDDIFAEGDIGIGTTSTASRLHVADDTDAILTLEIDPTSSFAPGIAEIDFLTGDGGGTFLGEIYVDQNEPGTPLFLNGFTGNDVILAFGGGNVGIGTDTPGSPLEVNGIIHSTAGGIMFPDGSVQTMAAAAGGDITAVLTPAGSGLTGGAMSGDVTLQVDFTPSGGTNGTATTVARGDHTHNDIGGGAIMVDVGGNVGIGTPPNPMFKLDVAGDIHTPGTISAGAFASNSPFIAEAPAGTPRLRIDDISGFVSIGSPPDAAPANLLDVDGNIHSTQKVLASAFASNSPFIAEAPAGTERMRIDDTNGNVGIGLSPVQARLHVGSLGFLASTMESASTDGTWLALGNNSAGGTFWQLLSTGSGNAGGAGKLMIGHGPAANTVTGLPMAIDSATDFVGLGTLTPETRLNVTNGTDVNGTAGGFLQLGASTGPNIGFDDNEIQCRNNGAPFRLALNAEGADVVIGSVIPGGNLGIGTSTPGSTIEAWDIQSVERLITQNHTNGAVLELYNLTPGVPNFLGAINFYNNVPAAVGQIGYRGDNQMTFRVNGTEAMRIDAAHNVGIGTTTPGQALDVVGNIQTDSQFISNVATGTPPLDVDSTTLVINLNSDFLDGRDESEFALLAGRPGGQTLHGGDGPAENLILDSTSDPMKGFVILNPTPVGPMTGSVGIGTTTPTEALEVVGCIKADCLKITADTVVDISPLSMVRGGSGVDLQPSANGTVRIHPLATGVQNVMIPVNIPNTLFGVQTKLKSIEICYKGNSATTFITASRFRLMRDAGTFDNLIDDPTDRKSTSWNCFMLAPAAGAPPNVFPPIDGPAFLNLELIIGGTAPSYDIEIGRIKVTLTEEV